MRWRAGFDACGQAKLAAVVHAAGEPRQTLVVFALPFADSAQAAVGAVLARVGRSRDGARAGRAVGAAAVGAKLVGVELQVMTMVRHAGIRVGAEMLKLSLARGARKAERCVAVGIAEAAPLALAAHMARPAGAVVGCGALQWRAIARRLRGVAELVALEEHRAKVVELHLAVRRIQACPNAEAPRL